MRRTPQEVRERTETDCSIRVEEGGGNLDRLLYQNQGRWRKKKKKKKKTEANCSLRVKGSEFLDRLLHRN